LIPQLKAFGFSRRRDFIIVHGRRPPSALKRAKRVTAIGGCLSELGGKRVRDDCAQPSSRGATRFADWRRPDDLAVD